MTTRTQFEEIDAPVDLTSLVRELYVIDRTIEDAIEDKEDARQRIKIAMDTRNGILKRLSKAGQFSGSEIKPIRKAY